MNRNTVSITAAMHDLLKVVNKHTGKNLDFLAENLKIPRGKVELLMFQLAAKELISHTTSIVTYTELTPEGKRIHESGLPENQLLEFLKINKTILKQILIY